MTEGIKEIQLQPGYFFSPGYYMQYWNSSIMTNFDGEEVEFSGKFKQHREMWIGSQLAALKTRLSGEKHFVGLPESDPPDVVIGTFRKETVPSGRTAHSFDWYPVEITRCDEASGETLLGQISAKNKHAYQNIILAVYLQGAENLPDMKQLADDLNKQGQIHPHEIIVMAEMRRPNVGEDGRQAFGFIQVYPNVNNILIYRDDDSAYFVAPNMMKITGRGVQSKIKHLETVRLMPPPA